MNTILIVDDEEQLRTSFKKLLKEEGYEAVAAATGEEAITVIKKNSPDLVMMDVRMPGMNGLDAFKIIHKIKPRLPVIIMTAYSTTDTAIEAINLGAFDYVLKPFDIPNILSLIENALKSCRFMRRQVEMDAQPENSSSDAIIGKSAAIQEVYKAIGRAAPTDATVLIRGESGTGKELVARAIYQHSLRAEKPFLVINCVAIPGTLLESELFGYEKGAFTGASASRVGKIEQANNGTLFLDEIGDMPVSLQSKILRLIQEKSIERLGGCAATPVDVRIIAATNKNLEQAIADGTFREDLYFRLNVVNIQLPPLRNRKGDVPLLVEYFLSRYSRGMNIDNPGITKNSIGKLENYSWPGNIRELANIVQKALIFSRGYPINEDNIVKAIQVQEAGTAMGTGKSEKTISEWIKNALKSGPNDNLFVNLVNNFSSMIISEALVLSGGNKSKAAKMLGLSRPTLQSKIEKYGVQMETHVSSL